MLRLGPAYQAEDAQWVSEWGSARRPQCVQEPPKSFQINKRWAWSKGFLSCHSFCIDYSLGWVSSSHSLWMGDCEIWNHQSRILEHRHIWSTLIHNISHHCVGFIHVALLLLTFFYQLTYFLKIQVNLLKILTAPPPLHPRQNLFFLHIPPFLSKWWWLLPCRC